jgi:hypothetical protein
VTHESYTLTGSKHNYKEVFNKIKSIVNEFMFTHINNGKCINKQIISPDCKMITYKLYNSSRQQIGELQFRVVLV